MKTVGVLGGCDCGGKVIHDVEAVPPRGGGGGGVVDRRVLTDAGLRLITCVMIQPDCQTASLLADWAGRRGGGGVLLIPVSSSESSVVCGGVEQNDGNGSGMSRSGL